MDGFQGALLNVKLPHLESWTARRRAIAQGLPRRESSSRAQRFRSRRRTGSRSTTSSRSPTRGATRCASTWRRAASARTSSIPCRCTCRSASRDLAYPRGAFPVAEKAAETCISLPIFPELTDEQVGFVVESVNAFG
jgi:dTDP-4-amino-4,6-dideoxygalactose transaminase